jgi:hypothetical protein
MARSAKFVAKVISIKSKAKPRFRHYLCSECIMNVCVSHNLASSHFQMLPFLTVFPVELSLVTYAHNLLLKTQLSRNIGNVFICVLKVRKYLKKKYCFQFFQKKQQQKQLSNSVIASKKWSNQKVVI